jgi:hypothetical protein
MASLASLSEPGKRTNLGGGKPGRRKLPSRKTIGDNDFGEKTLEEKPLENLG